MSTSISSTATPAPAIGKRAGIILKLTMLLFGPLVLLVLLEATGYVWERQQDAGPYAWETVASRRLELIPYPEPGAGYVLMAPGSRYEWGGIPVTINSQGLREREIGYEKPEDTFRILNLGDSVVMGWGVRAEETYGRQLEEQLNQQDAAGPVEVINAGMATWNLDNDLAFLQAEGLKYQPDLILLDVTLVNDIKGASALRRLERPPHIKWLQSNTYFWPFLTIQLQWAQARGEGRERIDIIDPPHEPAKYFPLEREAPQWTRAWEAIEAMNELAGANNGRFALILFPLEFQVVDESYPTMAQQVLGARAAEAGIPVLDLLPAFREACRQKPGGPCQLEDRYLFADVWMHPSAAGHALTANEIARFLAETYEN